MPNLEKELIQKNENNEDEWPLETAKLSNRFPK